MVTLGDVAEISAANAQETEQLASTELFPAPVDGRQRTVRLRELQDTLYERGVSLAKHRLSGAAQIVIGRPVEEERAPDRRPLSANSVKRVERAVTEAIEQYLQEQTSVSGPWRVSIKLTEAQAKTILADGRKIVVRGGQAPWTGTQQFEIAVEDAARPATLAVSAEVTPPVSVVATTRAIGRGEMIRPSDLRLQPVAPGAERGAAFHAVDEVAGCEAVQEIPAGTVLQHNVVRAPLVVHRGEVVTVYSRAAGIRIRVTARAKEDGSQGDLINVESLLDRKIYSARVCGIQEVEVYARATQAESPSDEETPRPAMALRGNREYKTAARGGAARSSGNLPSAKGF